MKKQMSIFAGVLFSLGLFAQECYPVDGGQMNSIKTDVEYLSSDELEGRQPGTQGEILARDYITKRLTSAGAVPFGENGTFYQSFDVPEYAEVDAEKTMLAIKGTALALNEQFYPLLYSKNGNAEGKTAYVGFGISAPEMEYDDYKKVKSLEGKIAVIDVSSPDGIHPHSEYAKHHDLGGRVDLAAEKGAIGVIFINLGEMASDPESRYKTIRSRTIPVVFIKDDKVANKLKKGSKASFAVQQKEVFVKAYNVVGYVDNNKPTTVVIGAHYDHLGWGGHGSLYVGEPAIHNGADDNASGTAALIALAEYVGKGADLLGHNYLFIAFTAEERGLLGSNYWVNHPTYEMDRIAYMINMDMVGRLRDRKLQISGTGTSEEFSVLEDKLRCHQFDLKLDPSGVGPSDHTSFYNMRKPVLHFFTGSHSDYHKPSDDAGLVNYKGITEIVASIKTTMKLVDEYETLNFLETKNNDARKAPKFSVTLGVMPNYMYEEGGLKIDGVTPEKPAAVAGLQKDDIIIELGDFAIEDIYAYMKALSAFKKGDKVKVKYIRDGETKTGEIQF